MKTNKPYLYCPKCKERAKLIIEVYDNVREYRKWDGIDTYELTNTDMESRLVKTLCGLCFSILEEK